MDAVRGTRRKPGAAAFMANLEHELLRLKRELPDCTYRQGGYSTFEVREPKRSLLVGGDDIAVEEFLSRPVTDRLHR